MTSANDWQFRAEMPAAAGMLAGFSPTQALSVRKAGLPAWRVSLGLSKTTVAAGAAVRYSGSVKTAAGRAGSGVVAIQRRPSVGRRVADVEVGAAERQGRVRRDGAHGRARFVAAPRADGRDRHRSRRLQ